MKECNELSFVTRELHLCRFLFVRLQTKTEHVFASMRKRESVHKYIILNMKRNNNEKKSQFAEHQITVKKMQ